jgi:hypothetical protein
MIFISESKNVNVLYHGTHISNLESIRNNGLVPSIGKIVKSTDSYQYYMDDEYFPEEYRVEGVLFFSPSPDVWSYSSFGSKDKILEDSLLISVLNNPSIFYKKNMRVFDYNGEQVDGIDYYGTYIPEDMLPPFIEEGDYFTFEDQVPQKIYYGKELKKMLQYE